MGAHYHKHPVITSQLELLFDPDNPSAKTATSLNNFVNFSQQGTYVNGAGVVSGELQFDGIDDYMHFDSVFPDVSGTNNGTWDVWAKPADLASGVQVFMCMGDTNANEYIQFRFQADGKVLAAMRVSGTDEWAVITDNVVASDNTWINCVLVHNGTQPTLHINGVAVPQSFSISTDLTKWIDDAPGLDNITFGELRYNTVHALLYNGSLGLSKIYKIDLDAGQLTQNYIQQHTRYGIL